MEREIELGKTTIRIAQGEDGVYDGATIFDAALVLIHYLAKVQNNGSLQPPLEGASVIDIGSGTGVVGISAAKLGAKTTLSDLAEGQPLLEQNILNNFNDKEHCRAVTLKWGRPLEKEHFSDDKKVYDYVLGSDITYILDSFEDLILTLSDLTDPSSIILISHELRKQEETSFYRMASQFFNITRIPFDELDETYRSEDIAIFKLTKKQAL